ncbi:MAG: hypothetical protein WA397_19750 [Roseiarcus sp.]
MHQGYCFFSGVAGVTGCEPPVEALFGLAPLVGPLPGSFVDVTPLVGPLPASAFGWAKAGDDRPSTTTHASKLLLNEDMNACLVKHGFQ